MMNSGLGDDFYNDDFYNDDFYNLDESHDDLRLAEAQEMVDRWIESVGVRYFSELTNLAQLVEEVGELARVMSRTYGDQSFKTNEPRTLDAELGDILFVLICIANQTGVDLSKSFLATLRKNTERDSSRHAENPKLSTS